MCFWLWCGYCNRSLGKVIPLCLGQYLLWFYACRTVQFAGMAAFHTRISDPAIGGTYMTLLITFSNLGQTWPRWFILRGVDYFTKATCAVPESGLELLHRGSFMLSE
jgi:hypothetical protein